VAAPTLSALERQYPKSARIPSIDGLPTSIENDQFDPKPALWCNSRTHVPQKLTGFISLVSHPLQPT
jgi:hypothetical protein